MTNFIDLSKIRSIDGQWIFIFFMCLLFAVAFAIAAYSAAQPKYVDVVCLQYIPADGWDLVNAYDLRGSWISIEDVACHYESAATADYEICSIDLKETENHGLVEVYNSCSYDPWEEYR